MKKSVLISVTLALTAQVMFAQLKVAGNGNVGVQLGTNSPLSTLSIGGVGQTDARVTVYSKNNRNGLLVNSTPQNGMWTYGIYSGACANAYYNIGVRGDAYSPSPLSNGAMAYGVMGYAGNFSSGCNYGVMGILAGSRNGAGIVGTTNGNTYVQIPGVYAGYFAGDVKVIGTVNGVLIGDSDIRYKKNIVALDQKKSLDNILQMAPIEYNLKQTYYETKIDSVKAIKGVYDENSQIFQKKHYGLIAQDLQKIYPDLVYQNDSGYLSVNYTGLIPVLIQSIKELNGELEILKAKTDGSSSSAKAKSNLDITEIDALSYPILDQNIPNPFNTATTIGFYLPATIAVANIYVYNMNGVQLKTYSVKERGKSNITIQGAEFSAGMYLYALIADGKVIDTKRMILTK